MEHEYESRTSREPHANRPVPTDATGGDARSSALTPRILVVEDEWFLAVEIEEELRAAGVEVLGPVGTVPDALEAIRAAAKDGGITAAILDMNLRGEWVTLVADRLAASGVPFVYSTGYPSTCDRLGHDAAPLLEKPVATGAILGGLAALGVTRAAGATLAR